MKRVMKFRAYDTVLKRMLTPEEVENYPLAALEISKTVIFDEYAGYSDSDKKEIYEHDFIETKEGERLKVIFSEGTFVAYRPGQWRPMRMFAGHGAFYAKVIGNCHENPGMFTERGK